MKLQNLLIPCVVICSVFPQLSPQASARTFPILPKPTSKVPDLRPHENAASLCAITENGHTSSSGTNIKRLTLSGGGSTTSIKIDPNLPVGTVIGTATFTGNAGAFHISCPMPFTYTFQGIGVATNNIYPTTIQGVGIMIAGYGGTPQQNHYWPNTVPGQATVDPATGTYDDSGYDTLPILVKFVKTSTMNLSGPTILSGKLGGAYVTQTQQVMYSVVLNPVTLVSGIATTCSVTTPLIPVNFGMITKSTFNQIGATSAAQNFKVGLYCPSSTAPETVYAALTDNSGNGNATTSTLLALDSNSTAQGLGVQVIYTGVTPNQTVSFNLGSSGTYQLRLGNPTPGQTTYFPFQANLKSTKYPVTPGSITTSATFLLSYE